MPRICNGNTNIFKMPDVSCGDFRPTDVPTKTILYLECYETNGLRSAGCQPLDRRFKPAPGSHKLNSLDSILQLHRIPEPLPSHRKRSGNRTLQWV